MKKFLSDKRLIVTILFISSLLVLLICSKNSPLYCYNDWVDGNAFFTMGKGIFNGKVPYKDLFEQKGPLLYLVYGIGYLMSHDTFIGVFILEIISYTFFAYFIYLISKEYINSIYSLVTTILTSAIIADSVAFVQGGSAEEFCLPLIAISMYSYIKVMKEHDFSRKYLYINGLIAGCVALIKFNLLGFWFIWMALYFFKLISLKEIKRAFQSCLYFLAGMFIPILLSIIYFGINDALKDYFDVYIVFNFTAYSTDIGFKQRIVNMCMAVFQQMRINRSIFLLLCLGLPAIIIKRVYKDIWIRLYIALSFVFLMIGVYIGGVPFIYYFLCFEFYIIFAFIAVFYFIEQYCHWRSLNIIILCCGLFAVGHYTWKSPNKESMDLSKKDYAQYVFKDIICESKDKTLLNFDNLDGGFYTTCDIVPNVKYFMRQNVEYNRYPQILDGQIDVIKNKETEFVIIREFFGNQGYRKTIPYLEANYKEIKKHSQKYEGMDFTYYLYQIKNGG